MSDRQTSFQDRIARIEATRAEQRVSGAGMQHVSTAEMEAHIESLKAMSPGAPKLRRRMKFGMPRLKFGLPLMMVAMTCYGALTMSTGGLFGGMFSPGSGASPLASLLFPSTSSAPERTTSLPTVGGAEGLMPDLSGSGMSKVHSYAFEKAGVSGTVNSALSDFHKATSQINR